MTSGSDCTFHNTNKSTTVNKMLCLQLIILMIEISIIFTYSLKYNFTVIGNKSQNNIAR